MSIFKRAAKTVSKKVLKPGLRKVVKPAARSFGRGATSTFNQTIGYGARSAPNARQLKRAVGRVNPVSGILKTTKALKAKPRRRGTQ